MERRNSQIAKEPIIIKGNEFTVKKLISDESLNSLPEINKQDTKKSSMLRSADKVSKLMGMNLGTQSSLFTRHFEYQAVILHNSPEDMAPLTSDE